MTSLVLTFITIVTFTTIVSGERICSEGAFDRTMDQKLTCGIFKTVAADLFICSKLCADTIKCFSTNTYEADNGTEMCDLIKGSKESLKYCFVGQQGSVYNEITSTKDCASRQVCSANPVRKALSDGWYQIGSCAFKHFRENKNWNEASAVCSANKGTLARFDNELEKQFVYKVIEESKIASSDFAKKMDGLNPFKHWRLDGSDANVTLHGQASYQMDDVVKVLDIPGTTGSKATTPKFGISTINFTLSMWVKMPDSADLPYSSWGNPHVFTFSSSFFSSRRVYHQKSTHFKVQKASTLSDIKWMHVTGVWNRGTRTAQLFHDGVFVGTSFVGHDTDPTRLSFPSPPGSEFDIGMQRDPPVYMKGRVRNLVAFTRPLTADEVKVLKDATDQRLSRSLWIGSPPASSGVSYSPDLNSGCVAAGAWGASYDWIKVSCDLKMGFICKKTV